jgi:hypothetical protein
MLHAISQETHAICAVLLAHAIVQHAKVQAMLQCAVFDEGAGGYLGIIVCKAVGEAKVEFRIGVLGCGAQHDNVA